MAGRTKKEKEKDRADSVEYLSKILKPGDRVFTKLEYVSSNGMTRHVSCYIPAVEKYRDRYGNQLDRERLTIIDISGHVADAAGFNHTDDWRVKVGGCGFDAQFDVVHTLGAVLFPNGGPAEFSERRGAARAGNASGCDEKHEQSGGYLLKQEKL